MTVQIRCPICDETWPAMPPRCLCGFDFETGDPSRAIIVIGDRLKSARRLTRTGIGVLLSIPVIWFDVWYSAPHLLLLAIIAFPLQLGIGTLLTSSGFMRGHRDRRRVKEARERMRLPAARVIER